MAEPVVAPAPVEGEPIAGGAPITAAWREQFEDADVKGSQSLDKFKGKDEKELLGHVAKAYVNLEKMPRGVTVPKPDAPQAEWDKFYDATGRPKTVEEYGIELKVPADIPWSKPAEKVMLEKARALGLNKRQAEGLLSDYLNLAVEGKVFIAQNAAKEVEQHYDDIQKEWGGLTDRNIALVQRCVGEFGGEEFRQFLDETNLGNDPRFLKFVHAMGSPMVEKNLVQGANLGMKSTEAKAEIDRLMKDPLWAKGDKAILAKINELYPIAWNNG